MNMTFEKTIREEIELDEFEGSIENCLYFLGRAGFKLMLIDDDPVLGFCENCNKPFIDLDQFVSDGEGCDLCLDCAAAEIEWQKNHPLLGQEK